MDGYDTNFQANFYALANSSRNSWEWKDCQMRDSSFGDVSEICHPEFRNPNVCRVQKKEFQEGPGRAWVCSARGFEAFWRDLCPGTGSGSAI